MGKYTSLHEERSIKNLTPSDPLTKKPGSFRYPVFWSFLGWMMGLEPTTTETTRHNSDKIRQNHVTPYNKIKLIYSRICFILTTRSIKMQQRIIRR
jgi:hypothetical protein